MSSDKSYEKYVEQISQGGSEKYHRINKDKGKLFVRDRLKLLFDLDIEAEDGFFANSMAEGLPADGVVTGIGTINGQKVCVMANDSTVKAGSWGLGRSKKLLGYRSPQKSSRSQCCI
ncbi:putative propionyl-CoA carboxylase beta chain 5 [Halalkalibacter krulwichiae]|uniref:Putative propionyl-CoA carboxylase beta chain 5 n=1 Tax=Halalkalibacter krulwichiae TaxID=199441 RepID=A0A1X9M8Y5_9BACI|nr:putative propionyl-CoA carboxylase beta chain 5 [Halalkalibacter krulwichiae]